MKRLTAGLLALAFGMTNIIYAQNTATKENEVKSKDEQAKSANSNGNQNKSSANKSKNSTTDDMPKAKLDEFGFPKFNLGLDEEDEK